MLKPEDENKIAEKMKLTRILYGAFLGSILIMTGLPLSGNLLVPLRPETSPIISVLIAVGICNLALGQFLPKLIFRKKSEASDRPGFDTIFNQFFVSTLISVALRESVSVLGLVSFMISGDLKWSMLFGGTAAIAMLLGWPTEEALRNRLRS